MDGHAPGLAKNIEAGELKGSQKLGAIVVERCGRVGDAKAHLFEAGRIVADKISLQRLERGFG